MFHARHVLWGLPSASLLKAVLSPKDEASFPHSIKDALVIFTWSLATVAYRAQCLPHLQALSHFPQTPSQYLTGQGSVFTPRSLGRGLCIPTPLSTSEKHCWTEFSRCWNCSPSASRWKPTSIYIFYSALGIWLQLRNRNRRQF